MILLLPKLLKILNKNTSNAKRKKNVKKSRINSCKIDIFYKKLLLVNDLIALCSNLYNDNNNNNTTYLNNVLHSSYWFRYKGWTLLITMIISRINFQIFNT